MKYNQELLRIYVSLRDFQRKSARKTQAICISGGLQNNIETVESLVSRAIDTNSSSSYSAWFRGRRLEKSVKLNGLFRSGDTILIQENRDNSGVLLGGSQDTLKNDIDSYFKRGQGGVPNTLENPLLEVQPSNPTQVVPAVNLLAISPTNQLQVPSAREPPKVQNALLRKLSLNLKQKVETELSEVERKKETKALVNKIKKKCRKAKLFNFAFKSEDDGSDEDGEDMTKIFKEFQSLTIERLTQIEKEEFPKLYKDNKVNKIKFINEFPKAQKYSMIRAIDYNKPKIYDLRKKEKNAEAPNGERMKKFLLNWFVDVESHLTECVSKDSILYPHTLENKIVMLLSKQVELRALSMQNAEDVWFIGVIKDLPKRIHDQMMLAKLLPLSSLRNLEQDQIPTSEIMRIFKYALKGSTFELIQFLYFAEDYEKESPEYIEELHTRLIKLFGLKRGGEDTGQKGMENAAEVFKLLQQFPKAQQEISMHLVDPAFLKNKFPEFQDIVKDVGQLQNMVKMIGTLKREAQVMFYKNLIDTVQQFDNMDSNFEFHPEILATKDRLSTREIMIDKEAAFVKGDPSKQSEDKARHWFVDFPVLTYLQGDERSLTMVHLADPKSERKTFNLEQGDRFLSFVDRFSDSPDVQISVLVQRQQDGSLVLRDYTYRSPFEKKDFTDTFQSNWTLEDKEIKVSQEISDVLAGEDTVIKKISLVEKNDDEDETDDQDYLGLLIQTDSLIYFQDLQDVAGGENLIDDGLSVKLEMLRGLSDKFYYALRDDGAASDALAVVKFVVTGDKKLVPEVASIPAAYTGEILALELDPLHTNYVESLYHDNTKLDEWQDKLDRIYVIDGRLQLFKLELQREPRTLSQVSLAKIASVQTMVETQIRGKDFIRLGITDRCLMVNGRTTNYLTGHEWDFIFHTDYDQPVNTKDTTALQVQSSTMLRYSNLQLALVKQGEGENQKAAFMIKNDSSSRKICLFDHRARDVLLFEPLSENLVLAKLRGSSEAKNYWSLMDYDGNIQDMPRGMPELLNKEDWVTVQSKHVAIQEVIDVAAELSYTGPMYGRAVDGRGILIVLSHYAKKQPDEANYNPFPNIGSVLIDFDAKKSEVVCEQFISRQQLVEDQPPGAGNNIENVNKTFQGIQDRSIRFKIVISDDNEILVFYADPERLKRQTATAEFYTKSADSRNGICLYLGALTRSYTQFFGDDRQPAVFGKSMFLYDPQSGELVFVRYEVDTLAQGGADGGKTPKGNPLAYSARSLFSDEKVFTVTRLYIFIPSGNCILSDCSPFYRTDISNMCLDPPIGEGESEDEDACHELVFPKTIQISYDSKTVVCDLHQIKKLKHKTQGRHLEYRGLNKLSDPEHYVDTGITLREFKEESCEDEKLHIWKHINASFSKDNYFVYQDWWWQATRQGNPRKFSFMGLYKKYSEADLYEIMRLQKLVRDQKAVRTTEKTCMYAQFKGSNLFHIFFRQVKVLKHIVEWLERTDFVHEHDKDDNEIENQVLRRIYYVMACHHIKKGRFSGFTASYAGSHARRNTDEDEKPGCLAWCNEKLKSFFEEKDEEAAEEEIYDKQTIACNSLLYRILRSNNTKSRDLILHIASYCRQYSIQNFFITQDDVQCVLRQPSLQVQRAFDDILVETMQTKQVMTLEVSFEEQRLITLWHKNLKIDQTEFQEMTRGELKRIGAEQEDIMMNSVSVKLMKIKWLREGGKNFLDLVEILNDTKNQQIIATKFVSCLLSGYWDIYFEKIRNTQFVPFVFYMVGMISFLTYALQEDIEKSETFDLVYFPLFGYCFVFIVNQARCEYTQFKTSETAKDYFLDYWNVNDLIYLVCNGIVMAANLFGHSQSWQVTLSAISVCFLWCKVFDWLRLFDNTAFFIRLIQETVYSIRSFLIILFLCYMMFGSAFYIININLGPDDEIMPSLSHFWVFNAFENQYELSLGEYEIDAYRGAEVRQFLVYLLFVMSSFLIQITFLNMLIAIMGDTFDRATEERDNNARQTKLKIMGDYIDLILKEEDDEEEETRFLIRKSVDPKEYFRKSFVAGAEQPKEEVEILDVDQDNQQNNRGDLIYVVQPDDLENENQSWEGHLSTLKRATEKSIGKAETILSKSLDKVLERVIEAESRDATQEREMKQNLDRVIKSVKDQIEAVVEKQHKQEAKQDLQFATQAQQFEKVFGLLEQLANKETSNAPTASASAASLLDQQLYQVAVPQETHVTSEESKVERNEDDEEEENKEEEQKEDVEGEEQKEEQD